MSGSGTAPEVARVDRLVDEKGSIIEVEPDTGLRATDATERSVGSTGPAGWSRMALIGVAIVAFILLMLQVFQGAPGTDVQPGTPTAEPVEATDAPTV